MEKTTVNPLVIFWQSLEVRRHLLNAGREFGQAMLSGLAQVEQQVVAGRLGEEYPYLHSALGNLQETFRAWTDTAGPAPRRAPAAGPAARPTRRTHSKRGTHGTRKTTPRG